MARRILVHIAALTAAQRERLTAAAAARGFETCFRDDRASALEAAGDAEILFTADAGLLDAAPKARWLCVPSAGAENYLKPVLEDRGGVRLSCSSGAYGVTIAEHIVMVTLTMFRRMGEYQAVVANRGWRRDLPMEYLPVRHLGPGKACRVSAQARKKGKRLLFRTTAVNFLLSLPALVGCAAVLAPYIGEHVYFSGNPQIVLGSLTRLMKTPLPMEQWVELLLVFLLLYLPFLILRKMRNAVAVRRLTRELNDAGGGHAAG